jgi:hypothetical protein
MINVIKLTATLSGTTGSATGTATSEAEIRGEICAIHFDYVNVSHSTTDVAVTTAGTGHAAMPIVTRTNSNTDGWLYPAYDAVGQAGTSHGHTARPIIIADKIKVDVSESTNNTSSVVVTVIYRSL